MYCIDRNNSEENTCTASQQMERADSSFRKFSDSLSCKRFRVKLIVKNKSINEICAVVSSCPIFSFPSRRDTMEKEILLRD